MNNGDYKPLCRVVRFSSFIYPLMNGVYMYIVHTSNTSKRHICSNISHIGEMEKRRSLLGFAQWRNVCDLTTTKKKCLKQKSTHSEYNEYNTKNIDHITMNSALRVNKKYILLNRLTLKKKKDSHSPQSHWHMFVWKMCAR